MISIDPGRSRKARSGQLLIFRILIVITEKATQEDCHIVPLRIQNIFSHVIFDSIPQHLSPTAF
ncbi:unnamed protein product [Diplocarpon coronariae]